MHLCVSTRTRSCLVSRAIAPVGQTCAQGAGSQCRHRLGTDMLYAQPGETWILDLGTGSSAKARAGSLLSECATAQANSHCRQPMQRSGLMNTVCMLVMTNLSGFGWDWSPQVTLLCHFPDCQQAENLAILACTYPAGCSGISPSRADPIAIPGRHAGDQYRVIDHRIPVAIEIQPHVEFVQGHLAHAAVDTDSSVSAMR